MNTYRNWTTTQTSRTPEPKSAFAGRGMMLVSLVLAVFVLVMFGVIGVHVMHTFSTLLNHMSGK